MDPKPDLEVLEAERCFFTSEMGDGVLLVGVLSRWWVAFLTYEKVGSNLKVVNT